MGDNEGEATITKKGPFGYNSDREQFIIKVSALAGIFEPGVSPVDGVKEALRQNTDQKESYDTYDVSESKKTSLFGFVTNDVILVRTSDPAIKQFLSENFGAKFDLKIEQLVMIDGKAVPAKDVSVPGGFEVSEVNGKAPTRNNIIDKIESLEGGSKYRLGEDMAFTVEEKAGRFFVVPAPNDSGRDLYKFLKSENNSALTALTVSSPVIAQLEVPKKKGEKQAVA
jgi:hypothetical protein